MDKHEEYLELCAAATAEELSADEDKKLKQHLAVCASCRRASREYEVAVQKAVPALADDVASNPEQSDKVWSIERAEAAFFERLGSDQSSYPAAQCTVRRPETEPTGHRFTDRPSRVSWATLWMPVAACALLAIALGIGAYRSGLKRGADTAQQQTVPATLSVDALAQQISDSGHERAQLLSRLADDDRSLTEFKREVVEQSDEIKRLKELHRTPVATGQNATQSSANRSSQISRRDAELAAAQTNLQLLRAKADALSQQRDAAASQVAVLETNVDQLTQLAREREQVLNNQREEFAKQQELLDHDRDIRELMGARDLYIAEVHDVGGNGQLDKTYGRVFYTKGKSLIFYAYDLDQEAGLKNASTFQAWGRRGADKQQALSLGVFYEDNTSKKRWVLKFDDPKALATIDAVFVTVEPNGGSHHPSGKELLFAYLRVSPNHP